MSTVPEVEANTKKKTYSYISGCCGKEVVWPWGERPKVCPYCGDKYWDKPLHEHILFHLQDEFIADYNATGSTKILGEKMFPVMVEYAENIIKGLIKGKIYLRKSDLNEKANDAATRLLECIYRSPDMQMHVSFGDVLQRWCKNVTFGPAKHDQTYSLQYIVGDSDTEFGDTIVSKDVKEDADGVEYETEVRMENLHEDKDVVISPLSEQICKLIRRSVDIVRENNDNRVSLLYLIGLNNRVSGKNEKQMNAFYEAAGSSIRLYVEKGELVMYEYLQEVARGGR